MEFIGFGLHTDNKKFLYTRPVLIEYTKEVERMLVVKAKIKEFTGDMNVSGDFAEALDKKVQELVKAACERAAANNRRTVMGKDI